MNKKCVFCHFLPKKHDFCTYICENCSTFAPDMRNLPIVTKSLLLANLVFWLLDMVLVKYGIQLTQILGLHYITADGFHWWQPLTYMFMHANFSHLFFNMFAVLMFGPVLEQEWGWKKFLFYYLLCGIGAAVAQELVWMLRIDHLMTIYNPASVMENYVNMVITIGASGAVFGILLAFGWLFPNVPMFIIFIPIPIRARIFVIIYAVIELFAGLVNMSGDNVAHFAHLGGMLFGLFPLLWWTYGQKWCYKLKDKWPFRLFHRAGSVDNAKDKDYSDYHYHRSL